MYKWVEERWPYFWPTLVHAGKERDEGDKFEGSQNGWIVEEYVAKSKEWMYGGARKGDVLMKLLKKGGTEHLLPSSKRMERVEEPSKEEDMVFATAFWELVRIWNQEKDKGKKYKRQREWGDVIEETFKNKPGEGQWRDENDAEAKEILKIGGKWITDDTPWRIAEVLEAVREGRKDKADPVENWAWAIKRWSKIIALWVGAALIFEWGCALPWGNMRVEKEWDIFLDVWENI